MDNKQKFNDDSDEEISKKHSQLLESIGKLDRGQRIKRVERSEPTLQVSEFHLVNSGITDNDAVCVDELVKKLGGRTHHKDISKKFNTTKRQVSVLSRPLEKPAADKLKRVVGFENTTKELEKWDAIVTRNRVAPNQVFPLQPSSLLTKSAKEFVKTFRVQSELEKELIALEPKTPDEEKNDGKTDEFSLTLEEIMQKRLESAKFRAQQSYKQAKAHRMKKIKSKKFHRMERNAKVKEQLKEFEKLQQIDPQAALDKLEQINKARAEERMSLKHKSTGQWAKNKQIRAKYNKESREALAQQLSISRELMQKVNENNNSDDEIMGNDTEAPKLLPSAMNNPWINTEKTSSEIDEFVMGYRKYWEKKHETDLKNKISKQESGNNNDKSVLCNSEPQKNSQQSTEKIVASVNPSEKVVQHLNIKKPHSNGNSTHSSCKKKKMNRITMSQSNNEKLSPTEIAANNKINFNSASKKVSDVVEKAGTSQWTIEIIDDVEQSTNHRVPKTLGIDEIFDTVDENIKQKVKKKLRRVKRKLIEIPIENSESSDDSNDHVTDLSFKKIKLRPELDAALDETVEQSIGQDSTVALTNECAASKTLLRDKFSISKNSTVEIDPNDFIGVKSQYLKKVHNNRIHRDEILCDGNEEEEECDENISQLNVISEAFADDNVIDEFKKEKMVEIEKSQSDNIIDTRLPGWGNWGGNNIKHSMKKKRRFLLKFPQNSERKDENKGNVILIEDNSIVKKHQVNDLPYPFSSVSDFEASIRAPIGRDFIPETAHKRLIEPAIKTKMGKIIEPMNEHSLIEKKNTKLNGKLLRRSKNHVTIKNSAAK